MKKTMRALVLESHSARFSLTEVPRPVPTEDLVEAATDRF
jgi:hypothetical protein